MDAKPQRIRVRGDENAPVALPGKMVHQRNKSTTALTGVGTTKSNAPRRAAFGDVSNTANPMHGSRDDISLAGKKQVTKGTDKPVTKVPEQRSSVLAQPAQRPISISGLKGILTSVTQPKAQPKPLEPVGRQITQSQQTANTRKTLNKRGTAVFKDTAHSLNETKDEITASKETNPDASDENNEGISRPSTALSLDENANEDNVDDDNCSVVKSDEFGVEEEVPSADEDECKVQEAQELVNVYESQPPAAQPQDSKRIIHAHPGSVPTLPSTYDQEPEEYWDDDEDDENEEDDGCVTARSYRSRGDNTTGGTMTSLFPKYNQQVRRELALAKQFVEATRPVEDIEDEHWDTSMVAEYGDEIFEYMREQELKMMPNANYMDYQVEIQWSMRSVLIDWVVQVHYRFSLLPETLFLCVNFIDRFLSCKIISMDRLQLVGATAMLIAAKYEEINCPSVWEIVYMVDSNYPAEKILEAERLMLYMLRFELGFPGPMSFLRRVSKADEYDLETRTLAKYFLEITIMDERFVGSPASFAAAGAHCLARLMLGGSWSPAHIHYSGYTYSQLHPLVSLMLECCENPRMHHAAIYEKYADKRFRFASLFVQAEIKYFRLPEVPKENSIPSRSGFLETAHHWKRVTCPTDAHVSCISCILQSAFTISSGVINAEIRHVLNYYWPAGSIPQSQKNLQKNSRGIFG